VRRAIEAHLGSRDVARVIYGAIIGLALVVSLELHPPTAAQSLAAIVGTAIAVALAEIYSEIVGAEARNRRPVARSHLRETGAEAAAVMVGAGFPAVFFVLALAGVMEVTTAFTVAKWTGLGLLCFYGYAAARLSGAGAWKALWHAGAVGGIGLALIALKALLH
jgi:hypothetical protein